MINYAELEELHRWMLDNSVLEIEVNGVRLKLAESALDVDQPDADDDEDDEPAKPVPTHESIRAAAAAARKASS